MNKSFKLGIKISLTSKIKVLFGVLLSQLIFLTNSVYAGDLFSPEATNTDYLIHKILKPYFGYGMGVDYKENPFSSFSTVFLAGLLVVMAILMIFHVVQGSINTANTGESMGNKASLAWTSLRSTVGVGILFPLGSSGLAAIQHAILYLAAQGVLFADTAWEAWVSNPTSSSSTFVSTEAKRKIVNNVKNIFLSELCVQAGAKYAGISGSKTLNWGVSPRDFVNLNNKSSVDERIYSYGIMNEGDNDKKICGEVTLNYRTTDNVSNISSKINTSLEEVIKSDIVNKEKVANQIKVEHATLTEAVFPEVRKIATYYLANVDKASSNDVLAKIKDDVQKIADNYIEKISAKIEQAKTDNVNQEVVSAMKKDGIASAGSFYFQLASQQSSLSSLVESVPTATVENVLWSYRANKNENKYIVGAATYLNKYSPSILTVLVDGQKNFDRALSYVNINANKNKIANYSNDDNVDENTFVEKFTEKVKESSLDEIMSKGFEGYDSETGDDDVQDVHPLIAIHNFGVDLLVTISALFVSLIALIGLGGLVSSGAVQAILIFSSGVLSSILMAIFIPALMMAFYIPLIPFILWIGALFGWIVMVVEALFGGPMWAITFLSPDKDGFVGRTGQGYMLILSLTLRPVLMILGLISSFILVTPILRMANDFYGIAQNTIGSDTNSIISLLFGKATFLIIYCILINKTIMQVFSLIHKIPDELLTWIGGPAGQLGGYASQVEGGVSSGSLSALAAANNLSNSMLSSTREASQNKRQKNTETNRDYESLINNSQDMRDFQDMQKQHQADERELKNMRNNFVSDNGDKNEFEKQFGGTIQKHEAQKDFLSDMQNYLAADKGLDAIDRNHNNKVNLNGDGGFTRDVAQRLASQTSLDGSNKRSTLADIKEEYGNKIKDYYNKQNANGEGIKITNDDGSINTKALMGWAKAQSSLGLSSNNASGSDSSPSLNLSSGVDMNNDSRSNSKTTQGKTKQ